MMSNLIKESFYLNQMATLTDSTEHDATYTILPQYGVGTFRLYHIIPGLSLSLNDFTMYHKMVNGMEAFSMFSKPVIKIDYCLKGKMLAYGRNGKVCVSGTHSTSYYAGRENIYSLENFNKQYKSITLCGYIEDIMDVFQRVFQIKRQRFIDFYNRINEDEELLVLKANKKVVDLMFDVMHALEDGHIDMIKLKALELLFYELNHIENIKNQKHVYFNRATIEKVKRVKAYIMKHLDEKMTISQLSCDFDVPIDTLKRAFKQMYSYSIYAYIKKSRLERGKELLNISDKGITEIALICGYNNHHSFSKAFKEYYKMTPSESRKVPIMH